MNLGKIKFLSLFIFLVCFNYSTYSSNIDNQDEKKNEKIFSTVELGVYKGLNLSTDYPGGISGENAFTKSLRLVLGYFINPNLSAGIGFGADRYESPGANTFPLFFDFRGYLEDAKNTPFVFFDVGKTIVFSEAQEGGSLFGGGFGYKFFIGEKTCLISKVGYNYFINKEWLWLSSDTNSWNPEPDTYRWFYLKRQSITFSIGVMLKSGNYKMLTCKLRCISKLF